MEIIEYETPISWDDKGMNWNTPDPRNVDYVMAIRQALLERCAALHTGADRRLFKISPYKTVSRNTVAGIVSTIRSLTGSFVNVGWEEFEEDYSDFPRMWTYGDLIKERNCRMYEWAKYGLLTENGGNWLKQIKNAIDKLTVIRARSVHGTSLSRSGSEHDPPFDESIGTAMEMAFKNETLIRYHSSFPSSVYAWSGNTHWCCPRPDFEGDPEDNVDGYCGYAQSQSFRLSAVQSWLKDASFDLFAAVIITAPTGPVSYSQVLDESVIDTGGTNFREGLNWTEKVRVENPYETEFSLGDAETIPKNAIVPVSEFDEEGVAITRHSTKRGWIGKSYGFLDYGVEGGFKFRGNEES